MVLVFSVTTPAGGALEKTRRTVNTITGRHLSHASMFGKALLVSTISVLLLLFLTPSQAYLDRLNDNLHTVYHETMLTPKRAKVFYFESDFNAVGDGKTVNTHAFKMAVEAAKLYNAQHDNAGVELKVGLPSENKTFVTGPFNLTSHFTLTVSSTNSIFASDDPALWPIIDPLPSYGQGRDHKGPRRVPFIGGFNVSDISIRGPGTIDGNGETWWKRHLDGSEKYTRGRLIETLHSDGILLEHITLQNSPFWTVHPTVSIS